MFLKVLSVSVCATIFVSAYFMSLGIVNHVVLSIWLIANAPSIRTQQLSLAAGTPTPALGYFRSRLLGLLIAKGVALLSPSSCKPGITCTYLQQACNDYTKGQLASCLIRVFQCADQPWEVAVFTLSLSTGKTVHGWLLKKLVLPGGKNATCSALSSHGLVSEICNIPLQPAPQLLGL